MNANIVLISSLFTPSRNFKATARFNFLLNCRVCYALSAFPSYRGSCLWSPFYVAFVSRSAASFLSEPKQFNGISKIFVGVSR